MSNELTGEWVDLHTYSKKFGVSLSTLRRRIRAKSIEFKLMRGRYWLPDTEAVMSNAPLFSRGTNKAPSQNLKATQFASGTGAEGNERAQNLEQENRRLKAQIAELETLVGVLESELNNCKSTTSLHS